MGGGKGRGGRRDLALVAGDGAADAEPLEGPRLVPAQPSLGEAAGLAADAHLLRHLPVLQERQAEGEARLPVGEEVEDGCQGHH